VSVARAREIVARLRAAGIIVHESDGCYSRGNGQTSNYCGGTMHHTATAFGMAPSVLWNGRPDLPGPLCNTAGNVDSSVTLVAAHPANHAGASGGRSMGPLPVTTLFNKRVWGHEIVYPGTVPMRDAQYRTAIILARIVADVCGGGNIETVRAHAETSITGKWDPGDAPGRTINMAAFRNAALLQREDDMGWTDKFTAPNGRQFEAWEYLVWTNHFAAQANTQIAGLSAAVDRLAEAVAADSDELTADELKAAVHEAIDEGLVKVQIVATPEGTG
jgi:hypothetical protein